MIDREPTSLAESLLETMIIAADLITNFSENLSEEAYLASSLHRSAVEHQVFIIGEALSRLSHIDAKAAAAISNARKVISARDVLAQGYGQIEDAKVWDVVRNYLPATIADVRDLIRRP
jgi:uncharacterized protein with HEPN domain